MGYSSQDPNDDDEPAELEPLYYSKASQQQMQFQFMHMYMMCGKCNGADKGCKASGHFNLLGRGDDDEWFQFDSILKKWVRCHVSYKDSMMKQWGTQKIASISPHWTKDP